MITVSKLTKRYGEFTAVDGIDLEVRKGEVFGFLGPNGAGKTTTIRMVACLSVPTEGSLEVAGHDVVREPDAVKRITGYIPDRPYLYEKLTGREHLRFVSDLYGVDWSSCRTLAMERVRHFRLERWIDSRIENYSHGMKQKLVLIGSLVHRPKILIIDEPMVGLDVLAQKQVKELFRQQAGEGNTVFLTTHTLPVAEAVCDRIAIIDNGKIIATGTNEELKDAAGRPGSPLEEIFLQLTETPE
ncbi:MAG: ABC transporter ATP-binding protein [Thermoanaerobaculia bacterium]|nr:ABC transporter ATP-binding protein [Thermoanaerobaculia bacterium]